MVKYNLKLYYMGLNVIYGFLNDQFGDFFRLDLTNNCLQTNQSSYKTTLFKLYLLVDGISGIISDNKLVLTGCTRGLQGRVMGSHEGLFQESNFHND